MIKSTLILLVLYFTATYGYERKGFTGYEYDEDLVGWFKLHIKPATWHAAKDLCIAEDASLVTAQYNEIDDTLIEIVKKSKKHIEYIYLGSKAISAPTKEDDAAIDVVSVLDDYYDDIEECVIMNTKNGTKSAADCEQEYAFVCYAPMKEIPDCDFSKPGNDREGWPGYHNCKDGWVKVYPEPSDFDEAKETCENDGGKIIDLNDPKQKEAALLVLKSNISAEISLIYHKAKKEFPNGGFIEVNGKKKHVSELGPFCTHLYKNGTMDDKGSCNTTASFICYVKHPEDSCDGGPAREGHPDYKSCKNIDGWIKVHPGPSDFKEAEDTCKEEGGFILDFNIPENQKIALEQMKNKSTSEKTIDQIFGKNKVFIQGVEDTHGLVHFKKNKEFCSLLNQNGTIEHDVDCDGKKSFICYVPYTITYDCEAKNYLVNNRTGNCYQLHTIGKTWNQSREHCQSEGGDLAVITGYEESLVLKNIWENYDGYYDVFFPLEMFVGIEEAAVGAWVTIKNETLEEAGYDIWAEGNPDEKVVDTPVEVKGVRKSCGCINMKAQYVNCWCDLRHGYMCKKKATMYKLGVKVE